MAYIGRQLTQGNFIKLDDLTSQFDGSKTTFNLTSGGNAFKAGSANGLLVSLAGVIQEAGTAYTINLNQITFATAPAADADMFIIALGNSVSVGTPADGTVDATKLSAGFGEYSGVGTMILTGIVSATSIKIGSAITFSQSGIDVTGVVTATSFKGDGALLTGVASTDNIRTNTDATFLQKVKVGTGVTFSPDGDGFFTGIVTATTFDGSGASLTNLPAANLTGTLPAISGANLTNLDASDLTGTLPAISGANLTNLDASDLASGTIPDARFTTLPAVSGANLTSLNASNLGSGTIPDARFPATLPAVSGANLTNLPAASTADINNLINNVAMLGFKVATNGSLAVYDLVDQRIDEFKSSAGVDASASTGETYVSGSGGYYHGTTSGYDYPTGGTVTTYGSYRVHSFLSDGSSLVVPSGVSGSVDYLIVGGGGGGGISATGEGDGGGGGGAGGVYAASGVTLSAGTYGAEVGSGGGEHATGGGSSFNSITVGGGGKGGNDGEGEAGGESSGSSLNGEGGVTQGGSGGGVGNRTNGSAGAAGGGGSNANAGGAVYRFDAGSGGGGAGEAGAGAPGNNSGGDGGDGITNDYRTGSAVYYGGGGGGGIQHSGESGSGGQGGGGNGSRDGSVAENGTANTGGGGGGASQSHQEGGSGGSGIVVVRYTTSQFTTSVAGADITLQSTDATAKDGAPTSADLIMLIDNGAGTTTENTDIKAYISRDSGSNFTQGTLVDEGLWTVGDSLKRILAFHNLDISGQPSGTSICYKITTHNQSASKDTQIHAVSYGWK